MSGKHEDGFDISDLLLQLSLDWFLDRVCGLMAFCIANDFFYGVYFIR